jgi:hypothetical protein
MDAVKYQLIQSAGGEEEVINWSTDVRLKWSDFKAPQPIYSGSAVAVSSCGFGYEGIISGKEVLINVFVRFYKNESWHDEGLDYPDVLAHEQLHFDICELFGRMLYKEVVDLRSKGRLTEKNLEIAYNNLVQQYDEFQDRYDRETEHSTVVAKQREWNTKIRQELNRFAEYSNYSEY